jgi:hypothetical protein
MRNSFPWKTFDEMDRVFAFLIILSVLIDDRFVQLDCAARHPSVRLVCMQRRTLSTGHSGMVVTCPMFNRFWM